ncbi:MAG: hypothetical protein KY458_02360 [Actinobacteria bacterium]|nr:hypothetical protein [Actinomycetota bacterium]
MPTHRFLDDQTVEALLAGRVTPRTAELGDLAQLVGEMRALASSYVPTPGPQLAAILTGGLTTEKGDLSATAASNVTGPAPQAAGLPKRRKKMFETLLGSALVKGAAVLAGLTVTAGAAAAADVLPQVAQDKMAAAMELVLPVDIPDSADAAKAKRSDGESVADEHKADVEEPGGFGSTVSDDATSGLPQGDGRSFGENVADNAPKAPQADAAPRPAETPTAGNNAGTSYRESAPAGQPEQAPTAGNNAGTSYRESAPAGQPEQSPPAEENGGSSYRDSAPEGGRPSRP